MNILVKNRNLGQQKQFSQIKCFKEKNESLVENGKLKFL